MRFLASLGFVALALGAHATLYTFDSGAITIPLVGTASSSPVSFNVAGLDGMISNVALYFTGITHPNPDDLGAVMFGSTNVSTILFDGPGNDVPSSPTYDWNFDESTSHPRLVDIGDNPTGFYSAGQNQWNSLGIDKFTGVPDIVFGQTLLAYNGTSAADATGNWNLFIEDFVYGHDGSIRNVQLRINTVPEPATLAILGFGAAALIRRRNRSQETFKF